MAPEGRNASALGVNCARSACWAGVRLVGLLLDSEQGRAAAMKGTCQQPAANLRNGEGVMEISSLYMVRLVAWPGVSDQGFDLQGRPLGRLHFRRPVSSSSRLERRVLCVSNSPQTVHARSIYRDRPECPIRHPSWPGWGACDGPGRAGRRVYPKNNNQSSASHLPWPWETRMLVLPPWCL